MNLNGYENYVLPALLVTFIAWRFLKFKKIKSDMPNLIKNGALIVDVRSPGEYQFGSSAGSINIPLNEITTRLNEIDKNKIIILCCASGARSGMASGLLKKNGYKNVINAGPWTNTLTK